MRLRLKDFAELVRKAKKLGIQVEIESIEILDDSDVDLNKIIFTDLVELLCVRGNEIGFKNALISFYHKGYISEDHIILLKKTIFYDYLSEELEKSNFLKKNKTKECYEKEFELF